MSALSPQEAVINRFPGGLLLDQAATDCEQMKRFWQIEQVQLEPGPYAGRIRLVHTAAVQVGHSTRSRGTHIDGAGPAGTVVFGFALPAAQATYFRRGKIESDQIGVVRTGGELATTCLGASVILTVAIAEPLIESIAAMHHSNSFHALCSGDRLQLDAADGQAGIGRRLIALIDERLRPGRTFETREARHFESAVLAGFANVRCPRPEASAPERRRIARLAAAYLREHARQPLALFEVCRAVATTPRSLELGFRETFGLCPKAFVQALRFGGAHRDLLLADPAADSVKAIALSWGFNHLGRFATEYRRWFGESPSATLQRGR